MSVCDKSALEISEMLAAGQISSVEVTQAYLDRIATVDPGIHAYLHICPETALTQARQADERRAQGDGVTAVTGVPIALKDNICARGLRTTCASRMLENFRPPYDATVTARLRNAGAVILGKTNLDEFAMGSSTENSGFGPTLNPWDTERIPGGSSGGSGAAVAAALAPWALGSDTGGSIRQPAAHCGVVGLKPTYGRVSRYGLVAYGSSLDQIGPMTIDVKDAALLLNVIAGHDPMDSTSHDVPTPDFLEGIDGGVAGMRIGMPKEYFTEGMDPEVEQTVHAAIAALKNLGAEVHEISLPHTRYAIAAYYVSATAEASSNLARYDGVQYGEREPDCKNIIEMYTKTRARFGDEVKRRIMLGTYALSAGFYDAYYLKSLKVRTLIQKDFLNAFESVDLIAAPVTPTPAFRLGENTDDPLSMYLADVFTVSLNLAGYAGVSVPCGFSSNHLPIGLQLISPAFEEARLLRAAYAYEATAGFKGLRPVR